MEPLTVNQYLENTYIGKSISFYIQETKFSSGYIRQEYSFRQGNMHFFEWEERFNNGEKYHFRDVLITDKIVGIKASGRSRVNWIFKTLNGIEFRFYACEKLDIIEL